MSKELAAMAERVKRENRTPKSGDRAGWDRAAFRKGYVGIEWSKKGVAREKHEGS